MKLRPLERKDRDLAVSLLAEGFPTHPRDWWACGMDRLLAHADEAGSPLPIGHFPLAAGQEAGICLTIPSRRTAFTDEPRDLVNVACFYLRPEHQWQAAIVARKLMADRSVEYTDVTASPTMRQINVRNGFHNLSEGAVVVPLPVAMLVPARGTRFLPLMNIAEDRLPAAPRELLDRHAALGCICGAIEADGHVHPVIFAASRRKGVPGARVILAENRAILRRAIGPLARHLIRFRLAFLELDAMATESGFPGQIFRREVAPYQTTVPGNSEAIDLTYSELVFLQPFSPRRLAA